MLGLEALPMRSKPVRLMPRSEHGENGQLVAGKLANASALSARAHQQAGGGRSVARTFVSGKGPLYGWQELR